MLKRLILSAFLCFAGANAAQILEVNDIYAKTKAPDAQIGEHAIVLHHFANNMSVVARAKVIKKEGDEVTLELYTFSDIAQAGMPVPVILPSVGDEVRFNYLYKNAILLAPNEESYVQLSEQIDANLLDPELLAAQIYSQGKLMPTRNDLRQFCANWGVGRLFVAQQNQTLEYDCASLQLNKTLHMAAQNIKDGLNFYSQIAKPAGNFYEYFSTLLYQE